MAKKGFERQLPSEHADEAAKTAATYDAMKEERMRKVARVLQAFDALLKTEDGRIVWGWLFDRCGYNKPILLRTAGGDVAPISTECAAAQREVYRDLRKMISAPELLAQAEYEAEFGVKPQTDKGEKK